MSGREVAGRVGGAAATGGVVGLLAAGLWAYGMRRNEEVCADATWICVSLYPLFALGGWLVLALLVFRVGLRLSDVRPLPLTVPVCTLLVWCASALAAMLVGHDDVPEAWAAALGGGLVTAAVAAVPPERSRMRVVWPLALVAPVLLWLMGVLPRAV